MSGEPEWDNLANSYIEEAEKQISALRAEVERLRDFLLRAGFVRCDIAACNCGSWHHRYGLPERLEEIKDTLEEAGHGLCNENGNLVLNALNGLVGERDTLRAQLAARDAEVAALRETIAHAYGYLWHVNNELGTPRRYAADAAAYEARALLRDTITHEQRGKGINTARSALLTGERRGG